MSDEVITVVHKITNMVETVPVSYYEVLKDVFRPITEKELEALKTGKAPVDETTPAPEARKGAK